MSGMKLSFSFSKIKKRPVLLKQKTEPKSDIQYISSIDEKKIKLCEGEPEEKKPEVLIIPLKRPQNKVPIKPFKKVTTEACKLEVIKEDDGNSKPAEDDKSLDALAVEELLRGNKKDDDQSEQTLIVPITSNPPVGEEESSLDDYEQIPIKEFGMGMLRGMGWSPGKGIGKSSKMSKLYIPKLRPKGMGLGADSFFKKSCDNNDIQNGGSNQTLPVVYN